VQSNAASNGATVTWTTNEAADTQVEWGLTTSYGNTTPLDMSRTTAHSVSLTGLQPETQYHFRVLSRDAAGNLTMSQDFTLTTAEPDTVAPIVSSVQSTAGSSGATISWATDEAADAQVEWGLTTSYGNTTPLDTTPDTSHSVPLSGLQPETEYHFRVKSRDLAGNLTVSQDYTFTTTAQPQSLMLHFALDEGSGTTVSGGGSNGTVQGASWTSGRLGNALQFDGSDDYVDLGSPDVHSTGTGDDGLTLAAWIKIDNVATIADRRILSKATGTANDDHYWMLSTIESGGHSRLRFRLKTGSNPASGTTTLIADSGNLQSGAWHHVAATYDGATMQLYLDGVLVGSTAKTGPVAINSSVSAWIGGNPVGGLFWSGAIDDVRIYTEGLSAADVVQLMVEDTTPPVISNVQSSPASGSASITWATDELADSQVEWGMTTSYGNTSTLNTTRTTSHTVTLSGLQAETTYHYRVKSRDAAGNLGVSGDGTFTTTSATTSQIYSWANPKPLPASNPAQTVTVSNVSQLINAVNNLQSGQTISIEAGTYDLAGVTDALYVPQDISDWAIRGATGNRDDVVIRGAGMSGSVRFGFWIGNSPRGTIADLTIDGVRDHGIIANPGAHDMLYHGLRIVDSGDQFIKSNPVSAGNGNNRGIVQYSIFEYRTTDNNDYTNGVDVHGGDDWIIRYNLFKNFLSPVGQAVAGPAILMWNGSTNTLVEGNTFINTARGISLGLIDASGFDHQGGVIRNNMFYRDAGLAPAVDVPIFVADSPGTAIYHNTVYLNDGYPNAIEYRFSSSNNIDIRNNLTNRAIVSRDGASGTQSGNVTNAGASLFVNVSGGDLHLVSTASVIDQGTTVAGVTTDLDGETRDSTPDIGADEFDGSVDPPTNERPVAEASSVTTNEDTAKTFAVGDFQFSDAEGDSLASITISSLSLASGDTLRLGGNTVTAGQTITAAQIPNLVYTPAANANGSGRSTFGFTVNDAGGLGTVAATMTIHVTAVNDVPVAQASSVTTNEDTPRAFAVNDFNFTDIENDSLVSITISSLSLASGDTLRLGGNTVTVGQTITAAQIPNLVYMPAANANGSGRSTFGFRVNDAGLGTTSATMTINVTAVNDVPVAQASSVTTNEDTAKTFAVGDFNFTDIENNSLASITISSLGLASGDTLRLGGNTVTVGSTTITAAQISSLVYTPAANANGSGRSTFGFRVNDAGGLGTASATMTINVTAVNDANLIDNVSLVVSPDAGRAGDVVVYDHQGDERFRLNPYPGFLGGVRIATGDVNGDGVPDIVTAPGPGHSPLIRVFSGVDGSEILAFMAYHPNFFGGVFVATGDFAEGENILGDGFADIIVSPDAGGGPHVRVFSAATGPDNDRNFTPSGIENRLLFDFFTYDPGFLGGVRVAAGDVTGDGTDDLVAAAGPGGGPHIQVFNGRTRDTNSANGGRSFFAYDPGFTSGLYVAVGNVNASDSAAEIITGTGPGGGPHVRIFNVTVVPTVVGEFFAYDPGFRGGVRVAVGVANSSDNIADIITSPGPGGGPHVRAFSGANLSQEILGMMAFESSFVGGLYLAGIQVSEVQPLLAAETKSSGDAALLTQEDVDSVIEAALARFEQAGVSDEEINELRQIPVWVRDLSGAYLGLASSSGILLDLDAAGNGWFIDSTPDLDEEFRSVNGSNQLSAVDPFAENRIDLLTVVLHEFGHHLGLVDLDANLHPDLLMTASLPVGTRRLPNREDLDEAFTGESLLDSLLLG
jgi:hypothetical protein